MSNLTTHNAKGKPTAPPKLDSKKAAPRGRLDPLVSHPNPETWQESFFFICTYYRNKVLDTIPNGYYISRELWSAINTTRGYVMTGNELQIERENLGLSITDMAKMLLTSRGTYIKWERDERRVPEIVSVALWWLNNELIKAVNIFRRRRKVIATELTPGNVEALAIMFECSPSAIRNDVFFLADNELSPPAWGGIDQKTHKLFIKNWDDNKCIYCGASDATLELDHIIPRSKGGDNHFCNMAAACVNCNRKKKNQTLDDFMRNRTQWG